MITLLLGLSLFILIPLFFIALAFDVFMFSLVFGFKALRVGFKILFAILGTIGVVLTLPILLCILVIL